MATKEGTPEPNSPIGLINQDFEVLVQWLIKSYPEQRLAEMRSDFHTRLRLTLAHPEDSILIEDLWDFFYDWCIFEQSLLETLNENTKEAEIWTVLRHANIRSLFTIKKAAAERIKVKDLFSGKSVWIYKRHKDDFLGLSKGDVIEARLISFSQGARQLGYVFARRPSFHPVVVHSYLLDKVKQFRKLKDQPTYNGWLWLLVGMYLKHRIYQHMPMEKIYDDNSRI